MSSLRRGPLAFLGIQRNFHELTLQRRVALSQLPLFAAVLLLLPIVYAQRAEAYSDPVFLAGLGLVGVLSVLSVTLPWDKFFQPSYWIIPILDFAAIALVYCGVQPDVTGTILLAVFPVFWLAWSGFAPRTAAALTVAGSLLIVWSPLLGNAEVTGADFLKPTVVPLVMLLVHLAATVMTQDADGQKRALEQADLALKQSLQDSRRRAQLLDAVLDTIDVGVIVLAKDGHVMLMNHRQFATHELALPEGPGPWSEADMFLFEPDGATPMASDQRPLARARRREAFSDSLLWVGSGAHKRALIVSARPMADETGAFNGSVVAFGDVTETMLALRAKDDFVASVSHELRTPLTSIIGYLDLAIADAEETNSDSLRAALGVAIRNAERLLVLVADLLTTASGSVHLELAELSLRELVASAADSAAPRAAEAGIRIQLHAPDDIVGSFDAMRMQQVLDNLISNAIKYSPGGGTVTLRVLRGKTTATLEVQDEGIGMTAADQSEVFNRFFRSAAVKKAAIPGVGLGLGITRDIVEAHGGSITLTSQPGQGTTFRVELPLESCSVRASTAR